MKLTYTVEEITEMRKGWRVVLQPKDESDPFFHCRTMTLHLHEKPKWHIAQTVEASFMGK